MLLLHVLDRLRHAQTTSVEQHLHCVTFWANTVVLSVQVAQSLGCLSGKGTLRYDVAMIVSDDS